VGFGIIGAHQFYAGKTKSGMIVLFTLGGVGIWYAIGSLIVRFGEYTDNEGKKIKDWV
jgi:TM2 domain-containing membrane protein YozV